MPTRRCARTPRAHTVVVVAAAILSVLILTHPASASRVLTADDASTASTSASSSATWSSSYATLTDAPRDVATLIARVDDAFERCGARAFLSRALDAYASASSFGAVAAARDAADVYALATMWCNNATLRDANATTTEMVTTDASMETRARSIGAFAFWLAREHRACSTHDMNGDDAVDVLHEVLDESVAVIATGKCWPTDGTADWSRGATSMTTSATKAFEGLRKELDAANVTYMENAFVGGEDKVIYDALRVIYGAYDACRLYGTYWESPNVVDAATFDRIRAHYSALDATLSNRVVVSSDGGYMDGRRFVYLINAARDVLASPQSCAAAPAIVPGRWFVSNMFDEIFHELALECGLMEVAADFLERYSNGRGSIVMAAELDEITATLKRCDEQSNETATMVETTINERALTELIGALNTLDASMTGCARQSQSAANRLAVALRDVLDKNQGQRCFGVETATLDSRLAQLIEPALTEHGGIQIRPSRPLSIIGALFYALVTSVMITIVAAFVWTVSRCKGSRVGGRNQAPSHGRKFAMRTASAYERHFDDIDETLETQTLTRTQQRPLGSPERPRPRPRRTSFSDFTRIARSKSLDPGAHHFA